jgi:hypothetical protein
VHRENVLSTTPTTAGRRSGLSNAIDIVIAPTAAFDRLREVPTWVWAFAVASVLGIIGSLLVQPALIHALETSMPAQLAANPAIAKLPPDQQQKQIAAILGVSRVMMQINWIFVPIAILIVGLIQGLVLTIANAIGKGQGSFAKFFALSITVCVIGSGLYYVVLGLIVIVRGASSFEATSAITGAVPGLALLVPGAHGFLIGFLAAFNVFYLWGAALLALGAIRVGRISPPLAWSTAAVIVLATAVFVGLSTRSG